MDDGKVSITFVGDKLLISQKGESRAEYRRRLREMSTSELVDSLDECESLYHRSSTENEKLKRSLDNAYSIIGILAVIAFLLGIVSFSWRG